MDVILFQPPTRWPYSMKCRPPVLFRKLRRVKIAKRVAEVGEVRFFTFVLGLIGFGALAGCNNAPARMLPSPNQTPGQVTLIPPQGGTPPTNGESPSPETPG